MIGSSLVLYDFSSFVLILLFYQQKSVFRKKRRSPFITLAWFQWLVIFLARSHTKRLSVSSKKQYPCSVCQQKEICVSLSCFTFTIHVPIFFHFCSLIACFNFTNTSLFGLIKFTKIARFAVMGLVTNYFGPPRPGTTKP